MRDDPSFLNAVRYTAAAVAALLLAGILTLMILARGKTGDDGDIAGVVAPALFLACASATVAVMATLRRSRRVR